MFHIHSGISYQSTESESLQPITTTDLLCWSFQITRGMQYLTSRKVLHGDLAARNILLSDNNVVKICDFGLARSLYKNDIYHKNQEVNGHLELIKHMKCSMFVCEFQSMLPFKWLAIESLRDFVFSVYTDVWTFGVVLFELFSLGMTPYPGLNSCQDLYKTLLDGYRMEKPNYATQDV